MFTKKYLTLILTLAVFALGGVAASAQTAPVRGEVKLKKADGTMVPVADAVVDAYRTDIAKGAMPSAKTNKKGEFTFVGFQLGQTYALAVSGPGIGPQVQPGVKAGREDIVIVVLEGDGKRPTETDVRQAADSASSAPAGGMTAAQKAEQAELEKKNAEIMAKNAKIQSGDETARRSNTEGVAALKAKDYDTAIQKFSEGVVAVPDYIGSTPVLLNGKMVALRARGYDRYREGAGTTDATARKAKYEVANKDYDAALEAFDQAMAVIKAAPAPANPAEQKSRDALNLELLSNAMEAHRLKIMSSIDTTKIGKAAQVVEAYIAAEPDAAKKLAARATLGDMYRTAGDFDKAVAAYKAVLETSPDNMEVMAKLGLSLVAQGMTVDPPNRDQLQDGLNYMEKYASTVQIMPTDSKSDQEFKQSVKETVEYLKTEQKLKAQPAKGGAAPKKKNG